MLVADPGEGTAVWSGAAALVLPSLGAALMYSHSARWSARPSAVVTGALLDYSPDSGWRPGVPSLGVDLRGEQRAVSVSLLGGRF